MSNKLKLWQVGLIVFILGGLANTVLIKYGIGGRRVGAGRHAGLDRFQLERRPDIGR